MLSALCLSGGTKNAYYMLLRCFFDIAGKVGWGIQMIGSNQSLFPKGMGFFVLTLTNFTDHESRVKIHGDRGASKQLNGEGG